MEHAHEGCACTGKKCKDCQEVKCIGYYRPNGKNRPSLKPRCQPCDNERKYAWARAHPERVKNVKRKYVKRHDSERIKMLKRKNAQEWNKSHPEQLREHRRKWKEKNPEHVKVYQQKWKANNLEMYRVHMRRSQYRRRVRLYNASGRHTVQEWQSLKAFYNYTCLCCGRREPEIQITLDHVIPLSRNGRDDIGNIQPLCLSCNLKKGVKSTDFRPQNT